MNANDILIWLAQVALTIGVSFVALLLALPTKIGDRLLGFHFDRKLAQLRDRQDQEIERLKDRLRHFEDRGKRSNEKEYEALSVIWDRFVDVVQCTERAVHQFLEHPDLNQMEIEEVGRFLTATDLSEEQRASVVSATDKNRAYGQSVRWHLLADAHNQIVAIHAELKKRSIFIPEKLVADFAAAIDICSKAEVTEFVRFRHPDSRLGYEDTSAFIKQKDQLLLSLRDATRSRLLRDLDG